MARPATVHCSSCGRACERPAQPGHPPVCAAHGPQWRHVRNAPAVSLVIRHRDDPGGPVLLARRAHEPYRGRWELTGGFVDLGEHPADAGLREAAEELGITVVLDGLVGSSVVRAAGGDDWLQITTYVASTADAPRPDGAEVSEAAWFALDATPVVMAGDHAERLERYRRGRWSPLDVDDLRP